jgi:hypothetical protein
MARYWTTPLALILEIRFMALAMRKISAAARPRVLSLFTPQTIGCGSAGVKHHYGCTRAILEKRR